MQLLNAALLVAMLLLLSERAGPLRAYLDPGTGSVALQLILGGVVAALATIKLYWDRLRDLITRKGVQAHGPGSSSEEC